MQLYLISYTAAQMVGVFFVPEVSAKLDKWRDFILSSLGTIIFLLLCAIWTVNDQLLPFLLWMSINSFATIANNMQEYTERSLDFCGNIGLFANENFIRKTKEQWSKLPAL